MMPTSSDGPFLDRMAKNATSSAETRAPKCICRKTMPREGWHHSGCPAYAPTTPEPSGAGELRELYRHYKGGLYEVVRRATMEHDGELCVVYCRADEENPRVWVRYAHAGPSPFFGEVSVDGEHVPRFALLRDPAQEPSE